MPCSAKWENMNDTQSLRTITKHEIRKLRINAHSPLTWGMLLEGGEVIFGNLCPTTGSLGAWTLPTKEFNELSRKEIDNSLTFHLPYKGIYVPLSTIKSIFGVYSASPFYGVTHVDGELVDWDSVENLMRAKYNIFVSHELGYKIDTWKKLEQSKKITLYGPTVLYSDWEWFKSISGGINSIGIGIGPISGNVGWSKSLSKVFWDTIGSSIKKNSQEAIIRGHVKILQKMIEIEGENWIRLNISPRKNLIGVCKRSNFLFPIKLFNKIDSLLTVYGDMTGLRGDSKKIVILKVRGIAFKRAHVMSPASFEI